MCYFLHKGYIRVVLQEIIIIINVKTVKYLNEIINPKVLQYLLLVLKCYVPAHLLR